jgi:hypothetical protein
VKHILLALCLLIPTKALTQEMQYHKLVCDDIDTMVQVAIENYDRIIFMGEAGKEQSIQYSLWINETTGEFISIGINRTLNQACLFYWGHSYEWLYESNKL